MKGELSEALRREIQASNQSVAGLARRLGVNRRTVAKWKARAFVHNAPRGAPTGEASLTVATSQLVETFRRHMLLPLDDCLYVLQLAAPGLSRSSLYREFQRRGLMRLERRTGQGRPPALGSFIIGADTYQTDEGTGYVLIAIDRGSKLLHAARCGGFDGAVLAAFLKDLIRIAPYPIRDVTFARPPGAGRIRGQRRLEAVAARQGIATRWAVAPPGPARSFPAAHRPTHVEMWARVAGFLESYYFARRLKTLGGRTPYENLRRIWLAEPGALRFDPVLVRPGAPDWLGTQDGGRRP